MNYPENAYRVGYARVDITPREPVPLAGFGRSSSRLSRAVASELYASCFAITDAADTTLLLISMDLQRSGREEPVYMRRYISETYGIPADHVMICGTHTHSGPDQFNDLPSIARWRETLLYPQLKNMVDMALTDRVPSRIFIGDVETDHLNFIKHYYHVTPEGEKIYFGDCHGKPVIDGTTRHATEIDPTMHIVRFLRQGAKDLVLANWRAHPHIYGKRVSHDISSDYVGEWRRVFESRNPALFTFFQGAAGNNNATTRLEDERRAGGVLSHGRLLAEHLEDGLCNRMHEIAPALIRTRQTILSGEVNKPTAEMAQACQRVQKIWNETGNFNEAVEEGREFHIMSPYQAGSCLTRYRMEEDTLPIELNAITLGDLAIVTAPNELFDAISVYVEENAPFEKVLTLGYANDYKGYIPTAFGFEYGSYEADCCYFKPGIGERIRDCFLDMLNELK